jgi:hypothetical protein
MKAPIPSARRRQRNNQSSLPRKQETLRKIRNQPIFRNQTVSEATGHHLTPNDWSASGREALEVASVGGEERSLPPNSVLALDENLDFDLGIGEGTPIHAGDFADRIVPPRHVLVRKVSDIVWREELAPLEFGARLDGPISRHFWVAICLVI